jgi:hypothetical protein
VTRNSRTVYLIDQVPTEDFVVDCEALRLDGFTGLKYSLEVSLVGVRGDQRERLATAQVRQTSQLRSSAAQLFFKNPGTAFSQLLL